MYYICLVSWVENFSGFCLSYLKYAEVFENNFWRGLKNIFQFFSIKDGALERTSEDLGDTWAEFGIGVNYRFVENMNVYVDVQKTGEATVDNKWQANLGFRYEF